HALGLGKLSAHPATRLAYPAPAPSPSRRAASGHQRAPPHHERQGGQSLFSPTLPAPSSDPRRAIRSHPTTRAGRGASYAPPAPLPSAPAGRSDVAARAR